MMGGPDAGVGVGVGVRVGVGVEVGPDIGVGVFVLGARGLLAEACITLTAIMISTSAKMSVI